MNQQPYQTPPRWWSPRLNRLFVKLWRPLRKYRRSLLHGLHGVDVRGLDWIREAQRANHSVLLTPNHASHADAFGMLEAADQLGTPFHYMTAWQVFAMTHRFGRHVLRQHGCFSINREGIDLRAMRQAINILKQRTNPLVIFPEGEVFHLNDRVMPFRKGAISIAVMAANRSQTPVSVVPTAMKFFYVDDPTPELCRAMDNLESSLGWQPRSQHSLVNRIRVFADAVLKFKERQYLGIPNGAGMQQRMFNLVDAILERLTDRYQLVHPRRTVTERIKQLRFRAIACMESAGADDATFQQCKRDLEDLFFATQLYSYPVDYLAGEPSIERVAETIDKLDEDVLNQKRTSTRGACRAVVSFGEPVIVQPNLHCRKAVEPLTEELRGRVQYLIDEINLSESQQPQPVADIPQPHMATRSAYVHATSAA